MAKILPYHHEDAPDPWYVYCLHTGYPPATYQTPIHLIGYSHYDTMPVTFHA
jgi:hypothetical protein